MTTIYVSGHFKAPTSTNFNGAYGYDNGSFFGPSGASLAGTPYVITWTGTDCNCYSPNLTGATMTVNGIELNLLASNNILYSEWLDHVPNLLIQVQTWIKTQTVPPFDNIYPYSQYTVNTTEGVGGSVYLMDSNHSFSTNAFITVENMGPILVTPLPIMGAGLVPITIACCVLAVYMRSKIMLHIG